MIEMTHMKSHFLAAESLVLQESAGVLSHTDIKSARHGINRHAR